MKQKFLFFLGLIVLSGTGLAQNNKRNVEKADEAKYPFWGEYNKTKVSEIRPATWIENDTITTGWDWSLPAYVKPAPNAYLCIARN